jgi:uncharacterized cupin superfamily protein
MRLVMADPLLKKAVAAQDMAPRAKKSNYPPEFAARVEGRVKRVLGDPFGLRNFGVNLTQLLPGAESALLHRHMKQDEFIYILQGTPTLVTDEGRQALAPGMCMGFAAGGMSHQLINESAEPVLYLEIGDRTPDDECSYPNEDLAVRLVDGQWVFTHKDGSPYR